MFTAEKADSNLLSIYLATTDISYFVSILYHYPQLCLSLVIHSSNMYIYPKCCAITPCDPAYRDNSFYSNVIVYVLRPFIIIQIMHCSDN